MRLARSHWEELVAHAREEAPNECCGYVKGSDGTAERVVRAENVYESPRYGFSFAFEALNAVNELDDEGYEIAIYHSHPRSPAEPSQMDINVAQYPHWLYLIISLENDEPQVRGWRIRDGGVEEEAVVVD